MEGNATPETALADPEAGKGKDRKAEIQDRKGYPEFV